jgi:hypothetical protein
MKNWQNNCLRLVTSGGCDYNFFIIDQNKSPPDVYSIAIFDDLTMTQQPDMHLSFVVIWLNDGYL